MRTLLLYITGCLAGGCYYSIGRAGGGEPSFPPAHHPLPTTPLLFPWPLPAANVDIRQAVTPLSGMTYSSVACNSYLYHTIKLNQATLRFSLPRGAEGGAVAVVVVDNVIIERCVKDIQAKIKPPVH